MTPFPENEKRTRSVPNSPFFCCKNDASDRLLSSNCKEYCGRLRGRAYFSSLSPFSPLPFPSIPSPSRAILTLSTTQIWLVEDSSRRIVQVPLNLRLHFSRWRKGHMLSTYVIVLLFIIIVIILVVIAAVMLFWLAYIEPLRRRKKRSRSTSIHPLAQNLQAHLVKFFVESQLLL
jgi:hypothetical protein